MASISTLTTSEVYERYVTTTREIAKTNPYEAMERAILLLRIAGHDKAQGTSVSLPSGTGELIAGIDREVTNRVGVLRDQHLDEATNSLQAKLDDFRLNATSAGYHLSH